MVRRGTLTRLGMLVAGAAALQSMVGCARTSRHPEKPPLATQRDKIAHLLRRAGFGYSPDDVERFNALGLKSTVDYLVDYEQVEDDVDARLKRLNLNTDRLADMQRWWLLRMIYTQRPLQEKMTLFWHGLLVSQTGKVPLPRPTPQNTHPPNLLLNQNQFFREHALDDFAAIMKGITRDPAMIVYLDGRDNRKGKPNENYAREVMELFTLGITGPDGKANYTEQDVREAARAFTGLTIQPAGRSSLNAAQHDAGPKTIFGKTGTFGPDDVIDLIMQHPANAPYICKRLFSFLAYDDPEAATLAPFVEVYRTTKGSIRAVVRAILTSPAFYSERAYRAKVKSPVEYVVGVCRALQVQTDGSALPDVTRRMGQTLFNPPNVAGWPGGVAWLNSSGWLERVNFATQVLATRQAGRTQPVKLADTVKQKRLYAPDKAVDYLLGALLDGQMQAPQRDVLLAYARQGSLWPALDRHGNPPAPVVEATPFVDRKLRGLVALAMAMPEYHLA